MARTLNVSECCVLAVCVRGQVLGEPLMELFNSLTFFMLAGNPLHCSCELRWFRRWMTSDAQSSAKVLDSANVLCVSPSTLTGHRCPASLHRERADVCRQ